MHLGTEKQDTNRWESSGRSPGGLVPEVGSHDNSHIFPVVAAFLGHLLGSVV